MPLVEYQPIGDIAVLTLNRPEKRNAMNDAMLGDLGVAVDRAAAEAKAAVLRARGKHFSAGLDLAEHVEKSLMQGIFGSRGWHAVFDRIRYGAIPYFVALNGAVVGGGLELAAVGHVRVAEPGTYFALPEGQRGIFVGGGGSVNATRLMGAPRMMDMMLTGRVLTAEEAERYGIVNYLAAPGGAFDKALELARVAAGNAPLSNYLIINALQRIHDSGHDEGLFFESVAASLTQSTPEARQRLRAFLEKKAARLPIPNGEEARG
ncbi:crotonase/enoyl-CoA hydratase family protein [Chelativorans intermedius]|uniref:Crotonase/enoyl-CoA hydratase family protein n=1 Tax=Chelativorans intermedius TaxID=515947 RepID=A0ABV6D608_9HYPH|nr:crotonase/enoyl-CoA hydratase family protein [Chelativorans intermedius]MCT8997455.1 crotonase/enoyl-CoA hydratase family protein [Chelativorans intermedius]